MCSGQRLSNFMKLPDGANSHYPIENLTRIIGLFKPRSHQTRTSSSLLESGVQYLRASRKACQEASRPMSRRGNPVYATFHTASAQCLFSEVF